MTNRTLPSDLTDLLAAQVGEVDSTFDVEDPATGEVLVTVPDRSADDALDALGRAVDAQKIWENVPPQRRSDVITRVFDIINERAEDFATTMTLEMGKPLAEARGEVTYGNSYFRWFAGEAVRIPGRFTQAPAGNGHILVSKHPVGPVLAITPWNFPLAMATRKIAPALAAGCPVVVKPAKETPLTMILVGEVIRQALDEVSDEFGDLSGLVTIVPSTHSGAIS
jgi:succinate-semialdehyde dehydrogenase/glutarate-semialdehyde dehydrogenase